MPTLFTLPSSTSQILERLLLGSLWSAKKLLERNPGVGLILNCTPESLPRVPRVSQYQIGLENHLPVSTETLAFTSKLIQEFFRQETNKYVLLVSHDGFSRAPAIAQAYLMSCGMGPYESAEILHSRHPATNISPVILKSVYTSFGWSSLLMQDLPNEVLQ